MNFILKISVMRKNSIVWKVQARKKPKWMVLAWSVVRVITGTGGEIAWSWNLKHIDMTKVCPLATINQGIIRKRPSSLMGQPLHHLTMWMILQMKQLMILPLNLLPLNQSQMTLLSCQRGMIWMRRGRNDAQYWGYCWIKELGLEQGQGERARARMRC